MPEPFKIGKIAHVAFIVRDLEAKMQAFWADFGIGPWSIYAFEPPRVKDMTYRGQRQDFRMRVAFAMCGTNRITGRTAITFAVSTIRARAATRRSRSARSEALRSSAAAGGGAPRPPRVNRQLQPCLRLQAVSAQVASTAT